jgi:RNA polymerase sigma factor (sigma-70 family)
MLTIEERNELVSEPMLTLEERNDLVNKNQRLAYAAVDRYTPRYMRASESDRDDMIAAAMLGLLCASRTFNPARATFSTHATWIIRRELTNAMAVFHRRGFRYAPGGVAPSNPGLDEARFVSSDDRERWSEQDWNRLLNCLSSYERRIIELTYRNGMRLCEAAELLGENPHHVRQIHRQAIATLRRHRAIEELAA